MDIVNSAQFNFCEDHLFQIISRIEPTETQKDGAKRSHSYLRDLLNTGKIKDRILDSYLSGSYARDTAVRPLEDVDVIFIVNEKAWPIGFFSSTPNPRDVLESFLNAIRYRYSDSSLRLQRRSVRLQLYHLDIDVVPAAYDANDKRKIWIPDLEKNEWIQTAPKIHEELTAKINQKKNGMFKPLVKLLKQWNNSIPETATFKSFAVETLAARLFGQTAFENYSTALIYFWDFVAALADEDSLYRWTDGYGVSFSIWGSEIPDITGIGSNSISGVSTENVKNFVKHSIRARDKMVDALKSRYPENAETRINEVFGF